MKYLLPLAITILVSCNHIIEKKSPEILISGSDTEAPLVRSLIENHSNKAQSIFSVVSEGTEKGILDLVTGKADIANASRPMGYEEIKIAKENGIQPVEVIIAHDALAIVTNISLGVDSLSIDQLRDIYLGKITNWQDVGGPNLQIVPVSRTQGSGTRQFFEDRVLWDSFGGNVKFFDKNEQILKFVKSNLGSIAYVGIGAVMDHKGHPAGDVWGMYLYSGEMPAVSPYERSKVRYGHYALCRPLYQYFSSLPQGDVLNFLRYILSKEGQNRVEEYGYFQINDEHRRKNKSIEAIL